MNAKYDSLKKMVLSANGGVGSTKGGIWGVFKKKHFSPRMKLRNEKWRKKKNLFEIYSFTNF